MSNKWKLVVAFAVVIIAMMMLSDIAPHLYHVVVSVIAGWQVGGWVYEFANKHWPIE